MSNGTHELDAAKNALIATRILLEEYKRVAQLEGLKHTDQKAYEYALNGYTRLRTCLHAQLNSAL